MTNTPNGNKRRDAGVADRVRYDVLDAATRLQEAFDIISIFDVVHDSADPLSLLRSIRDALHPDGKNLCLEINCASWPAKPASARCAVSRWTTRSTLCTSSPGKPPAPAPATSVGKPPGGGQSRRPARPGRKPPRCKGPKLSCWLGLAAV
jgi:SAM-dependent methyltransferase